METADETPTHDTWTSLDIEVAYILGDLACLQASRSATESADLQIAGLVSRYAARYMRAPNQADARAILACGLMLVRAGK